MGHRQACLDALAVTVDRFDQGDPHQHHHGTKGQGTDHHRRLDRTEATRDDQTTHDQRQRCTPEEDVRTRLGPFVTRSVDRVDDQNRTVRGGHQVGQKQNHNDCRHDPSQTIRQQHRQQGKELV